MSDTHAMTRRECLALGLAALVLDAGEHGAAAETPPRPDGLTIAVFTDPHYADREPLGSRHYRDSDEKLAEFVKAITEARPDFAICLGDFVDKGRTVAEEMAYLKHIDAVYRKLDHPRHYALGNHDLATLTKAQFLKAVGMPAAHYAFDAGPFHCIVLDANYTEDFTPYGAGNFHWTDTWVPPDEQKWLAADLKQTQRKTLVFLHQCLDDDRGAHGVKNGRDVRAILEASGKVLAVFNGHNHRGAYREINGIHYFTLRAMVEGPGLDNNAFALIRVAADGAIGLRGFGKQEARKCG